jgi:hypothetical protein
MISRTQIATNGRLLAAQVVDVHAHLPHLPLQEAGTSAPTASPHRDATEDQIQGSAATTIQRTPNALSS